MVDGTLAAGAWISGIADLKQSCYQFEVTCFALIWFSVE
jgi:hypothetical protein